MGFNIHIFHYKKVSLKNLTRFKRGWQKNIRCPENEGLSSRLWQKSSNSGSWLPRTAGTSNKRMANIVNFNLKPEI